MNFVDVQPQSFLDYAWTSPSPAPPIAAKQSRTSRKQNRCCDQCRKGKRACDAAILEDTLLNTDGTSGSPAVFHYSDIFGPLAPCGNCEKTKKSCTVSDTCFQWLREQRTTQAMPHSSSAPPEKKLRTQNSSSQNRRGTVRQSGGKEAPQLTALSEPSGAGFVPQNRPVESGFSFVASFGDILIPGLDISPSPTSFEDVVTECNGAITAMEESNCFLNVLENGANNQLHYDSGNGSDIHENHEKHENHELHEDNKNSGIASLVVVGSDDRNMPIGARAIKRIPRKRRRHSSSGTLSTCGAPCAEVFPAGDLVSSTNKMLLTEGLLQIYHDSFESHLSCWMTERTCPYSRNSAVSLLHDAGPDWNCIYHRVFKLDRLTSARGRALSSTEDKAASKAVNLAILSFASQRTQLSQRGKIKYPFQSDEADEKNGTFGTSEPETPHLSFDTALQASAWHQARMALNDVAGIESFRVVLAHLVFSLTQKPLNDGHVETRNVSDELSNQALNMTQQTKEENMGEALEVGLMPSEDKEMVECESLLSRLNLTMDEDGPPTHLEKGLRLIHSLRSRLTIEGAIGGRPRKTPRGYKQTRFQPTRLGAADGATVDILFWLGIMFDTLSSAMHKRPLVVSLEDSDLPVAGQKGDKTTSAATAELRDLDLWDDYLFNAQSKRLQQKAVRWPCSHKAATSLLCEAAPIKVLLFRKVTCIQTLLSRRVHGERMEKAIQEAVELCEHWGEFYAPFVRDCIENHYSLPVRVQSWYVCLSSHWHLATLLLADLIELIDESELSGEAQRYKRISSGFVASFREQNCRSLSDIARCTCPRKNDSTPPSRKSKSTVGDEGLLTEPWVVVLVRAFSLASVVLLESAAKPGKGDVHQDAFLRTGDCVRALRHLGQRSRVALAAAKIIGEELSTRRARLERGDTWEL